MLILFDADSAPIDSKGAAVEVAYEDAPVASPAPFQADVIRVFYHSFLECF